MKSLNQYHLQFMAQIRSLRHAAISRGMGGNHSFSDNRLREKLRDSEEGQSLIEFALMLPMFLLLITGTFAVGFALWNYQTLDQSVEAAARLLANGGQSNNTNGDTGLADPCQYGFTQINNMAVGLNPNNISVTYTLNGTTIGPLTGQAANTCAGDGTLLVGSGQVTVSATYPCNVVAYGLSGMFAGCQLSVAKTELSSN